MNTRTTLSIFIALFLSLSTAQVLAGQDEPVSSPWQVKRLMHANACQVALEQSGKIFVYYGLTDTAVDRSMIAVQKQNAAPDVAPFMAVR